MIKFQMFEKPSSNVRGIGNAFIVARGKERSIASVHFLTDRAPDLDLDIRLNAVTPSTIREVISALTEFVSEVEKIQATSAPLAD